MSKNIEYFLRVSLLIVCAVFVQLYLFDMKDIFHIDELFSYGLANSEDGIYLFHDASEIDNKLLSGSFFNNYLTQSDNFSFYKMWQNLKYDNHMPVYFVLLHFACTFFSSIFSPTPAIIINVLVLIFLIIYFYKLTKSIFKDDEIALATTTLFAFSSHVLGIEIFLRMYLLQMMCSVLLLKNVFDFVFNNRTNAYNLLCIMCISMLTILTHYYSIILCFFVTFTGFFILLMQKRHFDNLKFCIFMFFSVIIAYIIYPQMINVGLSGERGSQFVSTIFKYLENPVGLLKQQIPLFINPLFGNYIIFLITSSLFISIVIRTKKFVLISSNNNKIVIFFSLILFLFGFALALIMPNMTTFQIRYLSPIVPVFIILLVYLFLYLSNILNLNKFIVYILLWVLAFSNAFYEATHQDSPFYLRATNLSKRIDRMVNNADIWWGLGGGNQHSWIIHNYIDKLMTANEIWTLVDYNSKEFKNFSDQEIKKKRYAYLLMPKTQEQQPQGAIEWIKKTTGRQSYYLFTTKHEKAASMAFEASVFLVCPY